MQDVSFRIRLNFLTLLSLFIQIVSLASVVLPRCPILDKADLLAIGNRVKVSWELPLKCICTLDVKIEKSFFRWLC